MLVKACKSAEHTYWHWAGWWAWSCTACSPSFTCFSGRAVRPVRYMLSGRAVRNVQVHAFWQGYEVWLGTCRPSQVCHSRWQNMSDLPDSRCQSCCKHIPLLLSWGWWAVNLLVVHHSCKDMRLHVTKKLLKMKLRHNFCAQSRSCFYANHHKADLVALLSYCKSKLNASHRGL